MVACGSPIMRYDLRKILRIFPPLHLPFTSDHFPFSASPAGSLGSTTQFSLKFMCNILRLACIMVTKFAVTNCKLEGGVKWARPCPFPLPFPDALQHANGDVGSDNWQASNWHPDILFAPWQMKLLAFGPRRSSSSLRAL